MLKTAKKIGFFAFLLISLLLISRDVKADIDEGEVIHIGDNVTARLNKKGVLTISGKGDMCITTSGSITKEIEYTK